MVIFIIVGCVFILFGAFEMFVFFANKKYYNLETKGTIIRIEKNKSQNLPVYSYTIDGKEYETMLIPELYDKTDYKIEQNDTLLYNSKTPENIKLKKESYAKAYILFIGAIVLGAAIIILAATGVLKM